MAVMERAGKNRLRMQHTVESIELAGRAFHSPVVQAWPAKLVAEIQFMTPSYAEMRSHTHAWYKIARAEHAHAMAQDYIGELSDAAP